MSSSTVLILGAGVGGQVAARRLRRLLPPEHRVVVLDQSPLHTFSPALPWLALGQRRSRQITRPVRALLPRGVEFYLATVQAIDLAGQRVQADGEWLAYDDLIVALGAELAPEAVPGLAQAAYSYYDLASAERLAQALAEFRGGRVILAIASLPYKCPGAPYEGALLLEAWLRSRKLRDRSQLHLYTPEPAPLPVAGPATGEAIRGFLERQAIGFHPQQRLAQVEPEAQTLVLESGERVPYDLFIAIPPHRSPRVVREAGLTNEAGWVPVQAQSLETAAPHVYAIGDVSAIRLPNGALLPKAGVFAHGEAEVVAHRIAAGIKGEAGPEFDGIGFCWIGTDRSGAAFARGNFYARPLPDMVLYAPSPLWHWGKLLFEYYWLNRWPGRDRTGPLLQIGARLIGLPVHL